MIFTTFIRHAFVVLLLTGATTGAHAAEPTPSVLLCQPGVTLTDQNDRVFHLADLRGEPVLANMFYALCQVVYPVISETIRAILTKDGKSMRDGVRVLMVTVDLERDSVAALREMASAHGANDHQQVARTNASGTHEVVVLLNAQYRCLADGDFNHSSMILLLDAGGHINACTDMLGAVDPKLVNVMYKLVVAQR